ncbi:MAG TPA: lysine 2,3-aminomutase [Mycobacteriales bacterium]|nr:lysine 2,3-aminomutase [Mycobacteriales bacterium]
MTSIPAAVATAVAAESAAPRRLAHASAQPISYPPVREFAEPDWTRLPGFRGVTAAEWEDAQWQRAHCAKNLQQVKAVFGDHASDAFMADLERDQTERATMSLLVTPQMLNTMNEQDLYADPIRRYMLPVYSDRRTDWPSHPHAARDSLHEAEMWAVEGLTHRYPTKVLAEMLPTCPQYCGHCTRMDLVGNSVPQVTKLKFVAKPADRHAQMLEYLRSTPSVRDVVVSGGDVANMPFRQLEAFVAQLIDVPSIRDIRLATKALMGLPQHWLQEDVVAGMARLAAQAVEHDVDLAIHTHVNAAQSVTPLVAKAAKRMLEVGVRDVRNQGVLMRGVNATAPELVELCFTLLDHAKVMPYYFYMCDMIPGSEHWRVSVAEAQALQHAIMGYLPGFATPRIVCDVPYVGKRWVHQLEDYDRVRGISYWTKNYRTGIEYDDAAALDRRYEYYDPIYTLGADGQQWWRDNATAHVAAADSAHRTQAAYTG